MVKLPAEIEAEAMELMSGPPLGDGIGPGNTARRLNRKYGLSLQPEDLWELWRAYLPEDVGGSN